MKVGKTQEYIIDQVIEVDSWSTDHDKEGILCDEYEGKVAIKEVHEYKYLGFIVFNSASNVPKFWIKKEK